MTEIQLEDRTFQLYIPHDRIVRQIEIIASQLNLSFAGQEIEILALLDGAKAFADELIPRLKFKYNAHYQQVKSYRGLESSGQIHFDNRQLKNFHDKKVLILEDIVDSGNTLFQLISALKIQNPRQLTIASLLCKPTQIAYPVPLDFVGFEIGPEFVVGFGMDYNELGRELKDIYQLKTQ